MQNKFKATIALLISGAGAILTLPSISPINLEPFYLELINHGFIAATIGGLADWFAITALFRKPLGFISYRTEILKRNRKRIMEAIVDFVSNDLLSSRNIINNIKSENTAELLIAYFNVNQGRERVKSVVNDVLIEIATTADTKSIAKSLTPIIENEAKNIDPKQIVNTIIKVITKDNLSRRIISNFFEAVNSIYQTQSVQESIKAKINELIKDYEADSPGRSMVLNSLQLNDEKILTILNENIERKIKSTIKTLKSDSIDPDAITTAANLSMYFAEFLTKVMNEENTQKFIDEFKKVLANNFDLTNYIEKWLDKNLKSETYFENLKRMRNLDDNTGNIVKLERIVPVWQGAVEKLVDSKIDEFINGPVLQDKFDKFVKSMLENVINKYHYAIPGMINDRLNALSDEEMIEFVEGKVSDDLQMIRINGSICGGFVGLILYLISYGIRFATGNL